MIKIKYIGDLANSNKHKGIITIATELNLSNGYIRYKFNCCSPKDRWNKKFAFIQCHQDGNWYSLPIQIDEELSDENMHLYHNDKSVKLTHKLVMYKVLLDIIDICDIPSWAYKLLESHVTFYGQTYSV